MRLHTATTTAITLLLALGTLMSEAAHAQTPAQDKPAPPNAFFTEAADCTAAFQARVVTRLTQPRSDARNKAILRDTEMGFIFIGVAYKEGLRKPEADQMLQAAEKRWNELSKAEQETRLNACTGRSSQLMDDVTGIERFFVRNRAKARFERLLEKEAAKPAAK